ncbi:MAG: TlyA family RNA methyltransferase [Lachnospiraceae bacterium]|nr:TlyA family RNA methyltransferase [Lachnospiraceae bacterium]
MLKIRLDRCLVDRGLCATREKARDRILAGEVLVGGVPVTKPGAMIAEDADIEISGDGPQYVGRGGLKLDKLLEECKPSLKGLRCLDVGASTGGFTDAMLRRGARCVWAVDVGTDQLVQSLREDPRVISLEKTDIRTVTREMLGGLAEFAGIDVSFISLTKILPAVAGLLAEGAEIGCLIKPQFEAGRANVGKHGIVKDPKVHAEVLKSVLAAASAAGFVKKKVTFSPITGGSGNIEYLMYAAYEPGGEAEVIGNEEAEETVHEAFLYHSKQGKGS